MKIIEVDGINVNVSKKKIKNIYISIKRPHGEVFVSAPQRLSDAFIKDFIISKLDWIKLKQPECQQLETQILPPLEYTNGEQVILWGESYTLEVVEKSNGFGASVCDRKIILSILKTSTVEQRKSYIAKLYREELKREILLISPKYEEIIGVSANEWRIKDMHTRWGTCNSKAKRIWISLQLAEKDPECLAYVIAHELTHLLEQSHNSIFKAYMDNFFPNWKIVKERLNSRL